MIEGTLYAFDSPRIEAEDLHASSIDLPPASLASNMADHMNDSDAQKTVSLIGRSGKKYAAQPTALENLRIRDDQICLLGVRTRAGLDVVWFGSGQSLVHDQPNRAEFMDVVNSADNAFIIDIDDVAQQSLASWDLTNTQHDLPRAA